MRRWTIRVAIALGALGGLALLHIPIARSLGAGCPFERGTAMNPEQLERTRRVATERLRADEPARARPARAFTLGASDRAAVMQWAAARRADCRPGRDARGLECSLSPRETVYADFDSHDRLVAMLAMTRLDTAGDAARGLAAVRTGLADALGTAGRLSGPLSADYLAQGPLRQSRVDYRHADYFATASATNLGHGHYLLSETYRAID